MKAFINTHKKIFFLTFLFSCFCFWFMLTHYMVSIDEETWLLKDSGSPLWLLQGRFSIYIYNLLFTTYGRFVPFFSDMLGIIFWNVSGILFAYIFFDFEQKGRWWVKLIMLCYYNSVPLCVGEAFAFTMQIIPEAFAMALTAAAFVGTIKPWLRNKYANRALILVFLIFSCGVYQALISVYVTAVAAWCFSRFLEKDTIRQELLAGICYSIAAIAVYYILNFAIGKIIGTASYLTNNYIGWTNEGGVLTALFLAFANVARVSLGITIDDVYVYGAVPLRILMVLFIIACITLFFKENGLLWKAGITLFSLGLVLAPFSIYIAMGTYKTHGRMLIALSLSGMVEILIISKLLTRNWLQKAACAIFSYILIANAANMNQIYFSSYLVYQYDRTLAGQIMYDIQRLGFDYHNKVIVFVGNRKRDNTAAFKSGTMGASLFEWDGGNISRIVDFMQLEGYKLHMPSYQQTEEGLSLTKEMAVWPQEGSIVETEDSIVVYLSEPNEKWYVANLGK